MERDPGNGSRRSRGEDRLDYAATGNKAVGCEWMTSLFHLDTLKENMIECIEWSGPFMTTHGTTYGITPGHETQMAHRISYECWFGGIPDDYVIDHLCRNGRCINPLHLEAVPNVVNVMRGMGTPAQNARKTHCKNGHEFTSDNLSNRVGRRVCKQCSSDYNKKRWAERTQKQ